MALHHAASGELMDVRPLGPALRETISTTLVRVDDLEVFRLVLPKGSRVPDKKSPRDFQLRGDSTIQCLEGSVELMVGGRVQTMRVGNMMYLAAGENHSLLALDDSAVLVTMLLGRE